MKIWPISIFAGMFLFQSSCNTIQNTDIAIDNETVTVQVGMKKTLKGDDDMLHRIDSIFIMPCQSNNIKYLSRLNDDSSIVLSFIASNFKDANYLMLSLDNIKWNSLKFGFKKVEDSNVISLTLEKEAFCENAVVKIHSNNNQLNFKPSYLEKSNSFMHIDNISEKSIIYRLTPSIDENQDKFQTITIGYNEKFQLGKFITSQSLITLITILASISTIFGVTVISIIRHFRR